MHRARESGKSIEYFSGDMKSEAHKKLILEKEMNDGLMNAEFQVYYQPQIDIRTGTLAGMEALVRWRHPVKGLIPPNDFIPVAEESGLIVPVGAHILMNACIQTSRWNRQWKTPVRVGVNLSIKQLVEDEVVTLVSQILHMSELDPEFLEIEITESLAIDNLDSAVNVLNEIRSMGVKIAMDDFGTGYSSLSVLQKLPLDTLKIDRAFVKDINAQHENGELACAIIAMAKSLGLHIIAEGVEEKFQHDFLRQHGVDEIQGFYYSPPIPADQFEQFVANINRISA
jgi:EAL domain-containing protein (putative c-di-GMP-specific phosphodiesterase class I)